MECHPHSKPRNTYMTHHPVIKYLFLLDITENGSSYYSSRFSHFKSNSLIIKRLPATCQADPRTASTVRHQIASFLKGVKDFQKGGLEELLLWTLPFPSLFFPKKL